MPSAVLPCVDSDRTDSRYSILPVELRGVAYSVAGTPILRDIDLVIDRGGCTAVMGYNGAGKTVLLRVLHGLIEPVAGTVTWALDLPRPAIGRRQAMVFQHPMMLRRSAAENVRFAMKVQGLSRGVQDERLARLLAAAGLTDLAERPAAVLSGGERQRLAVIRALSVEPEILFLDEPTASLDPASARSVEDLIAGARDRGTKIVLVTQSVPQAQRLCHEVVFIHEGRLAEHSPAARFFERPESDSARTFVEGRYDA
jgi:tungstate transport system ATP-binding protein